MNISDNQPPEGKIITEEEFLKPKSITEAIATPSVLKEWIINYVGNHPLNKDNLEITVASIAEVFAEDFPEFLLSVAEENWIRGYHQALADVDEGAKLKEKRDTDG
tara:strand:- start:308 stop:625 length:318 start_codon:yes stop_codon:yes gene_type:complete